MPGLLTFLFLALLVAPASAQPGRGPDRILRTETVAGSLAGWQFGDYLWARIDVRGRARTGMQLGPDPIGLFLEAHRGRPLTLTVATVSTYIPEAGGMNELQRIVGARAGRVTARLWWGRLTPAQRRAARRRFEDAIQ